jgi:uncharacterized protein YegP (UPF0339 family)
VSIEFYVDEAEEHRWRLRGANGEIIGASTEGFSSLAGAEVNAELVGEALGLFSLQKAHGTLDVRGI